jgi:hypothetical protein
MTALNRSHIGLHLLEPFFEGIEAVMVGARNIGHVVAFSR